MSFLPTCFLNTAAILSASSAFTSGDCYGWYTDHHRPFICLCPFSSLCHLFHSILILLQVLAIGFLLVILSAALWQNYLPLLVVATYVIAPLPNWACGKAANRDDFMESGGSGFVDFGRFLTGFLVVMGIGTFSTGTRVSTLLAP